MGCSKADQAETIAALVRICRHADRVEVPRAILLSWPDVMIDELWQRMFLAASRHSASGVAPLFHAQSNPGSNPRDAAQEGSRTRAGDWNGVN